ncbi:MAG: phosphomethylpyrimidine synthase [bacterium]|nr:phosphomethylpyrimidine synthase [bacterium]
MKLPIVTGDESFPASRKVHVLDGELQVPQREIALSGGEPPMRVYDTSGPQGHEPTLGLPKLRAPWIERRTARGDRNF